MSKTLRRPMFRGGSVNSYNTGITSGLDEPGYANGGRVAARVGGFFSGLFNRGKTTIPNVQNNPPLSNFALKQNVTPTAYPKMSLTDVIGPGLPYSAIGIQGGLLLNAGVDLNEARKRGAFDGDMGLGESEVGLGPFFDPYNINLYKPEQQKIEKEKLEKNIIQDNKEKPKSELDKLKEYYENLIKEKEKQYKTQLDKDKEPILTDEEQLTKQTELYQKLLGGDEAKSQAVYDALLAASPAFFKGKNLREAAPEVLTAINKSGAFDKPRDIRQAAAQLAIQRNILKEKATAEEKARLAIYGAKNQETLSETLKNIPGSFIAGPLPKGSETNPNLLRPGGIYSVGDLKFYAVPGEVVDSSGKKKQGVVGLQKL